MHERANYKFIDYGKCDIIDFELENVALCRGTLGLTLN